MTPIDWPELYEAVAAAKRGDQARLRQLIDWQLVGLPTMLAAVSALDKAYRAPVVASGLSELENASDNPKSSARILGPLMARFAQAALVYPASPAQRRAFFAALRRGDYAPEGLTPELVARLAALGARAEAVTEAYVLSTPQGELVVGRVPITGRIVFVLSTSAA